VRDFNHVDDTIDAFLRVGDSPKVQNGRVYNAGSGHGVTISEVVDIIRKATGANKPVETEAARIRPDKSEVRELVCDARLLTAATGWNSKVSLSDGVAKTVTWWRKRLESGHARADARYIT